MVEVDVEREVTRIAYGNPAWSPDGTKIALVRCDESRGPGPVNPTLRCDVRGGDRPLPPRPRSCAFDWGVGMAMVRQGRARILCASDTVNTPRARVLPYGWTFRRGGFTCVARRVALRCQNADRHGFSLSRMRSFRF